jgi:starch phosphorylase
MVRDKLAVFFVSNYDVPYAEKLIPAADISEQISTAGTKVRDRKHEILMNGAVTLGTVDGANVEISARGARRTIMCLARGWRNIERIGDDYNPRRYYESNRHLARVMNTLVDGTLGDDGTGMFKDLFDSLLNSM